MTLSKALTSQSLTLLIIKWDIINHLREFEEIKWDEIPWAPASSLHIADAQGMSGSCCCPPRTVSPYNVYMLTRRRPSLGDYEEQSLDRISSPTCPSVSKLEQWTPLTTVCCSLIPNSLFITPSSTVHFYDWSFNLINGKKQALSVFYPPL